MAGLKELILSVQGCMAPAGFAYVDKDWGQLRYDPPAVKFPCALVDIELVGFSQLGHGHQLADVSLTVTIAHRRLVPTSTRAPGKRDGHETLELVEVAHRALQLHREAWFAPLVRTELKKVYMDNTFEVYAATYGTQFTVEVPADVTMTRPQGVRISIDTAAGE